MAKILVVDDEVEVCSELAELLEEEGGEPHKIDCAERAADAIKKVKSSSYDIIFLDVLMPKMEGLEAMREIRKITNVPVVIMSAYFSPDLEKQAVDQGALACLSKPFKISDIRKLISQVKKGPSKK